MGELTIGAARRALRSGARRFKDLPLLDVAHLLRSEFHEERLLALLLFVQRARSSAPAEARKILKIYLKLSRSMAWASS